MYDETFPRRLKRVRGKDTENTMGETYNQLESLIAKETRNPYQTQTIGITDTHEERWLGVSDTHRTY